MSGLRTAERLGLALTAAVTALAGFANYGKWAPVPRFVLATVALAGLAWIVAFSTSQLGERFGPGVTGVLQSTLGNLPELFVVVFALQKHELVVAQTAIVGSIFANALLLLGLVIIVGASRSRDGIMRFSHRLPRDTATLLVVTAFIIVVLGLSLGSHDRASHHYKVISAVGAACLLVVYLAWIVPYIRSDVAPHRAPDEGRAAHAASEADPAPHAASDDDRSSQHRTRARLSLHANLTLLLLGGAGSGFVSDWFVNALAPAIKILSISQAFAGLVIVAIAGNAVENSAGIFLAYRRRYDLAISVVKNSVAQIAAFLFPLLVLISFALATTLTFSLAPVYIGALVLTALALAQVTGDGEAAAFEGWALVAIYVILATLTQYE